MDHAESGHVDAHPDRKRQYREGGVARIPPDGSNRVREILEEYVHQQSLPGTMAKLLIIFARRRRREGPCRQEVDSQKYINKSLVYDRARLTVAGMFSFGTAGPKNERGDAGFVPPNGNDRWYEEYVPTVDRLYDDRLDELRRQGLI